ncbi:MAG: type II toxin-antitoxin system VapC family toxin [Polyangiaceae bacterium]
MWAFTGARRLSASARRALTAADAHVFVSSVTLWEIAIKHALGRGDMPVSADVAAEEFEAARFDELAITWSHVRCVGTLPDLHRDPFDRLLVAQSLVEPMTLLTHDARVAAYSASIRRV